MLKQNIILSQAPEADESLPFINKNGILKQLFRYGIVGGIAFLADFGVLFLLTEYFHCHYLISAGIGFGVGLGVNYFLSIRFVFEKHTLSSKAMEFVIFCLIGVAGLFLNEVFIWFFTEKVHFYYIYSKIIATIFVFIWNFIVRKFVLFA